MFKKYSDELIKKKQFTRLEQMPGYVMKLIHGTRNWNYCHFACGIRNFLYMVQPDYLS